MVAIALDKYRLITVTTNKSIPGDRVLQLKMEK